MEPTARVLVREPLLARYHDHIGLRRSTT